MTVTVVSASPGSLTIAGCGYGFGGSTVVAGPRASALGPSVAGKQYWVTWTAPKSSCAWIKLVVPIGRVSNGCCGGLQKWDAGVIAQNDFGNLHAFHDFGTGHKYTVDFAPACDVHDAGDGSGRPGELRRGRRLLRAAGRPPDRRRDALRLRAELRRRLLDE